MGIRFPLSNYNDPKNLDSVLGWNLTQSIRRGYARKAHATWSRIQGKGGS